MYKRIMVSILTIALLASALITFSPSYSSNANADDYRNGFSLTPLDSDSTGVKPDSKFSLKSQKNLPVNEIRENLTIDGEPSPIIRLEGSGSYSITPSRALEQNKVYTFILYKDKENEVTWSFQTSMPFKLESAFPADKSTNVPVNTGIELYFSHEDFDSLDKYFSISPSVKGTFEIHKKAAVFVPQELKEGTVYTVTVKKGLKLNSTDYSLKEDYTFSFETAKKADESVNDSYKGYFSFNKSLNEYSPSEKPCLPINYYVNKNVYKSNSVKVHTTVYGYKDIDSFISALKKKDSIPYWAYYSNQNNLIKPAGLNRVVEFEQEFEMNPKTQQFIKIPQVLPAGYYIIDSTWDKLEFQTFIEVTDVGMYIMRSDNKTLVWLNDLSTKKPIEGAELKLLKNNSTYHTDKTGIAYFNTPAIKEDDRENRYYDQTFFKITTKDKKTAILNYYSFIDSGYYNWYGNNSMYWNFISMDRNLYKPDDTVNFWGLVKNRYSNEDLSKLTVEIGYGYRVYYKTSYRSKIGLHYFPTDNQPLVVQHLTSSNGIFKGSLALPNLDPGGYQLTLKKGDETISSSYITVENYTKPTYKMDITKDKQAIFPGQTVKFDVAASFFEGTGLPNLDIGYNINGGFGDKYINSSSKTDDSGKITVSYTPSASKSAQGENYASIYAHATLPESGQITADDSVRVFVNDVNVNISTDMKKNKKTINAVLNDITLDRLNNGTAKDYSDYLSKPTAGKELKGTVYRNTWVKVADGQYYDFINKVTRKTYRYDLHKEAVKQFSMTTDKDGKTSAVFDLPDIEDSYYTAEVFCTDNSGRNMKFSVYFGENYLYDYNSYNDTRYYLFGKDQAYKSGQVVSLTFKKGKTALPEGKYLYIKSQNGIREYTASSKPIYSFAMSDKYAPNIYVTGIYFNGTTYIESELFNAAFDYQEKELTISAKADKTSYKPGDTVTIKINAKDKSGKPKKAVINASIVDEALFKLQEQYFDTLSALYSSVPSGIDFSYESHVNSGIESANRLSGSSGATYSLNDIAADEAAPTNWKMQSSKKEAAHAPASVRQDFKDTAYFNTITTDNKGYGELTFKIPDNITSWRVTLSGVTTDLSGGSNKVSLKVTLPFFINSSFNTTYLAGDKPVLGATAYGSKLKAGDKVHFEVSSSSDPSMVVKGEGAAFDRVDIPLWKLNEGKDGIIIKAYTDNGLSDALKQEINVIESYHQIDAAQYYDLKPGIQIQGGESGITRLIFLDKSRGMFLPELTHLMYTCGNRIDQKLSNIVASDLIKKYFKDSDIEPWETSFNPKDYQKSDGGLALLPYGNSEADLTAKLAAFVKDDVNAAKLKEYFYDILYGDSSGIKGNALYGLSVLKEPVLLELDKAAKVSNASIKDMLYIALAYCQLGEIPKAQKIYNELILKNIEEFKPYFRVNTGSDNDDILECTSLASILAAKLDMPQKEGLYNYCISNYTQDILINIEKLLYINEEIGKHKEGTVKISYSLYDKTETKELNNGQMFALKIPSQNLSQFKVNSVEGEVSLVSLYKQGVTEISKTDDNISVSRSYTIYGDDSAATTTFKKDDIVKVHISWDAGKKALDGSYQITDYLPSGLKPIDSPALMGVNDDDYYCYYNIDGQKVTFYVYKNDDGDYRDLTYYARVVSPGTYTADGTIIQSMSSKDSINVSNVDIVEIK